MQLVCITRHTSNHENYSLKIFYRTYAFDSNIISATASLAFNAVLLPPEIKYSSKSWCKYIPKNLGWNKQNLVQLTREKKSMTSKITAKSDEK